MEIEVEEKLEVFFAISADILGMQHRNAWPLYPKIHQLIPLEPPYLQKAHSNFDIQNLNYLDIQFMNNTTVQTALKSQNEILYVIQVEFVKKISKQRTIKRKKEAKGQKSRS